MNIGLLAWFGLLLGLLRWSKDQNESPALWLPVAWLFIIATKLPSQWLGLTPASFNTAFEEGSSLDRIVYLTLISIAIWVLTTRQIDWADLFAQNYSLVLILVFALASVTWSDFPYVTFKRWFRDLGTY